MNKGDVVACEFVLPSEAVGENTGDGEIVDIPVRPCTGCGRPISPERLEAIQTRSYVFSASAVRSRFPSDSPVSEVECPQFTSYGFKSRLVWRSARDPAKFSGYFLGCSRFPDCRYIDQS